MWVINVLDNLLRVADVHLDLLGEAEQCALHEVLEERKVLEDLLVRLFQELSLQALG